MTHSSHSIRWRRAVLDPLRAADQAALKQRQATALTTVIAETLLVDAANKSGVQLDSQAVEQEMVRLATQSGGDESLAAELGKHGVTIEDVRSLFERGFLANEYVDRSILPNAKEESPEDPVRVWLDYERWATWRQYLAESRPVSLPCAV